MAKMQNVTGPVAYHAEGPVWSPEWGGLRFVDLHGGDLLTVRDNGVERLHVAEVAAFHRPRVGGGYVVATGRDLALSERPHQAPGEVLPGLVLPPGVRFNDGACSPAGTLYAGTMAVDGKGSAGSLFRISCDGVLTTVLSGVGISNGLAFSPNGTHAYYVDTATGRIDIFDNENDHLVRRRPFVDVAQESESGGSHGVPDGLCVDEQGCVWVAIWGGSAVHCYTPEGRLERVVAVPATQVSACTFGGPDLSNLYVTTSREGHCDTEDPQAGSQFVVDHRGQSLPTEPFAWRPTASTAPSGK